MPANTKKLHKELAAKIQQEGPISIADYMGQALKLYYSQQKPFGREGDFITAPEISQMFGEMIGLWLMDLWIQMGSPAKVQLIELGPGRGTLMSDIMRTISSLPDFKAAIKIHLVEISPRLREEQRKALEEYPVEWHDDFLKIPEGCSFIVANEFFDALPIHQFEKTNKGWVERFVDYNSEEDSFIYSTRETRFNVDDFPAASVGDFYECSPASLCVLEGISKKIEVQGGVALFIDYGHTESGLGDTLQAVQGHAYSNVLEHPGDKDITAHVDFGAFKSAMEKNVDVFGAITQGSFLKSIGIQLRAQKLSEKATPEQREEIASALHRLIDSEEMGELFKVMVLLPKNTILKPLGF